MTRSLGSTPITRASSLLRTGPPTEPATVLTPQQTPGLLPLAHCTQNQTGSIGSGLLTFRVGAADRARVASMPDTAWPINGHPPSSSRDKGHTPVLMPSISFDTSTANRLRSPSRSLPSASRALFPHRSPRSRHRSRSMWRFEASPRRATSKGQPSSPTQHHISKLRLHRTPLCVRDTHPHLTRHARLFHIAHHSRVTAPAACGGLKPPPAGRLRRANNPSSPAQHHFRKHCLHRTSLPRSGHTKTVIQPHRVPDDFDRIPIALVRCRNRHNDQSWQHHTWPTT